MNLFAGGGGLLDLLVCLALLYILYRIPHWILGFVRVGGGGGRSLVGSLVKGFLMAKTFGALTGRDHAGRSAGASRRTVGPSPRDPAWPGKIHAWHGVDGPRSLGAMEQRMRAWQASERAHRTPPSTVGPVRFQQAAAQTPTHDLATSHVDTAPAPTTFRAPTPPAPHVARPRPSTPPAPMTFRTATPTAPPLPPMRTAAVPAALRFVPPTPAAEPAHPGHATTAPPPVTFTYPGTPPVHRRARTHTPAPTLFRAAEPPSTTAPPTPRPAPAPTRFRAPATRRAPEPPGGEK
ncbi:hypothetical protein [Kutzneria sp. NPDC052558]|uniref:hypothetical protein n=1 Tax=Kutzneria sp. NPDC052558 TaxID=3364121 RepID=UPI0037CB241E